MIHKNSVCITNEMEMLEFGATLAKSIKKPVIIYLMGALGAGKTTLVRGFLQGLGYKNKVKSPTYTLVETYHLTNFIVHHFDLYRLNNPYELEEFGVRDYFAESAICLIEWPEKGGDLLPLPDITCEIKFIPEGREISQNIT